MKFSIEQSDKIKLIIWDLDETFWRGILSDNNLNGERVKPIGQNIKLIKTLSERGIINSICSKNDSESALRELRKLGVEEYFVFNSIDWEPKGGRIKTIIESMSLRAENVLFIDDNPSNLAEAEFCVPSLMVADPSILPDLREIAKTIGKEDKSLSRLKQYRILEKKKLDAVCYSSNIDFLRESNIKIQISKPSESDFSRLLELILRSNQLNYTKKRISEKELRQLAENGNYDLGYIKVSDSYGKYGIVGFYALNLSSNELEHFLFSCRTMGMGIEQYVYAYLNYPVLKIIEPVSSHVSCDNQKPDYIRIVNSVDEIVEDNEGSECVSVLMKGPCDLEVMASYIEKGNISIKKEFNFVDSHGNQADYFNHFINILNSRKGNEKFIDEICDKYCFFSKEAFQTELFTTKHDIVCLSPLMDATLAVYEDSLKNRLAFGLYSKPLTEKSYHQEYLNKSVMTAHSNFKAEDLNLFSQDFSEIDYTPKDIVDSLDLIIRDVRKLNKATKFVIILLAELEYKTDDKSYNKAFSGKEKKHRIINDVIRKRFKDSESVYLLDTNKYVKNQADYFDGINHYSKYVYYQMAVEFKRFMEENMNTKIETTSKIKVLYQHLRRKIYKALFIK